MFKGLHKSVDAPIASGTSESTYVQIFGANRVAIEFPDFGTLLAASTANGYVSVAQSPTDTFYRLQDMGVYSANSGIRDWEIPAFSGARTVLCRPVVGFNYMKVGLSTAATDGITPIVHIIT